MIDGKSEGEENFHVERAPNNYNEMISDIYQEVAEKWKMNSYIEARISQQTEKVTITTDKLQYFGICTNSAVILKYIKDLFEYTIKHYKTEFLQNIQTNFGFGPDQRLKLIHGYESFNEGSYPQLPFVLSEDIFIEFEQNVIGNGNTGKEQIIKEFEHIHNKAIFDTFNEALNLFRPYFMLGGSPYSWYQSEKNLILGKVTKDNLEFVLERSKQKILDQSQFLCGILIDKEPPKESELEDLNKGIGPLSQNINSDNFQIEPKPLNEILENLQPENEFLSQTREERLSRMLLTEIFENEFKWNLYEDEKAEVSMELADLIFEEIVEDIVIELNEARK